MRFRTSGDVRRVDLSPLLELFPAVLGEWEDLRFDTSGRVVNPLSGELEDALVLLDGRHRQTSARYRASVARPPDALVAEGNEPAPAPATYLVTLHHDGPQRLSFTVAGEPERWSCDVDLHHSDLPRVEVVGRVDLGAALGADGSPGWVARLLGRTGGGKVIVDLGALEGPGGSLVEGEAHANRFRGSTRVEVSGSRRRWHVDGRASLGARGVGRLVLLVVRRRIRRGLERGLAQFWARGEEWTNGLERDLHDLRRTVEQQGGPAPFVRRSIWDPGFDPGLDIGAR